MNIENFLYTDDVKMGVIVNADYCHLGFNIYEAAHPLSFTKNNFNFVHWVFAPD